MAASAFGECYFVCALDRCPAGDPSLIYQTGVTLTTFGYSSIQRSISSIPSILTYWRRRNLCSIREVSMRSNRQLLEAGTSWPCSVRFISHLCTLSCAHLVTQSSRIMMRMKKTECLTMSLWLIWGRSSFAYYPTVTYFIDQFGCSWCPRDHSIGYGSFFVLDVRWFISTSSDAPGVGLSQEGAAVPFLNLPASADVITAEGNIWRFWFLWAEQFAATGRRL